MGYGIRATRINYDVLETDTLADQTVVSSNNIAKIFTEGTMSGTFHASTGDSTTQFDITNPSGSTFRYTYDGNGTDPNIGSTIMVGDTVTIQGYNFNANNNGTFTITGVSTNYFEITNASGVAENNVTLGTLFNDGYIWNVTDLTVTEDVSHNLGYNPIVRLYITDSYTDKWYIAPVGIEDTGNAVYRAGWENLDINTVRFTIDNPILGVFNIPTDYTFNAKYFIYLEPEDNPWYE